MNEKQIVNDNNKHMRMVITNLIENAMADAVVIAWSSHAKGKTTTYLGQYGNVHITKGLTESLYEAVIGVEIDDDE